MEKLIHCRKCGKIMKREIVDGWKAKLVCGCGFSDFELISGVSRSLAPQMIKSKKTENKDVSKDIGLTFECYKSEREKMELVYINEVSFMLATGGKRGEMNEIIISKIFKSMNAITTSLYLLEGNELLLKMGLGINKDLIGKVKLQIGEGITGLAAEKKELIIVEDISLDERSKRIDGLDETNLKAMAAVPILFANQLVGVINVKCASKKVFYEDEIYFVSTLSNLLALNICGFVN